MIYDPWCIRKWTSYHETHLVWNLLLRNHVQFRLLHQPHRCSDIQTLCNWCHHLTKPNVKWMVDVKPDTMQPFWFTNMTAVYGAQVQGSSLWAPFSPAQEVTLHIHPECTRSQQDLTLTGVNKLQWARKALCCTYASLKVIFLATQNGGVVAKFRPLSVYVWLCDVLHKVYSVRTCKEHVVGSDQSQYMHWVHPRAH